MHDGLHGVGRVGAQHQHLAVGHVDDAQEPEGDRQAERREEQHAGQRQPVQEIAREPDHALVTDDAVARACRRGANPGVRLVRLTVVTASQHLLQQSRGSRRCRVLPTTCSAASRTLASGLCRSTRAIASVSASRTLPSRSRASARCSRTAACASPPLDSSLAAASRTAVIRATPSSSSRQHRPDHPPDFVADLHLRQRPRLRRDDLAGHRVVKLVGLRVPDVRVPVRPHAAGVRRRARPAPGWPADRRALPACGRSP